MALDQLEARLRRVRCFAKSFGRAGLDAVLPPLCPVTEERLAAPGLLSAAGWAQIQFIAEPYCDQCGVPFATDYGAGAVCPSCLAEPPSFDAARAGVVYHGPAARLIVSFKHSDRTELAPLLAAWVVLAAREMDLSTAILSPVPLHRRRLLGRRFNQAALLAKEAGARLGVPVDLSLLRRRRATPAQQRLSKDARRRNVAGAFEVPDEKRALVEGAHIALVDDVLTTGATLSACARALRRAGAARVDALAAARVVSAPGNVI